VGRGRRDCRLVGVMAAGLGLTILLASAGACAQSTPSASVTTRALIERLRPHPLTRGIEIGNAHSAPATTNKPPSVDLAVNFAFGSAALTADGELLLDNLGRALNDPALRGSRFSVADAAPQGLAVTVNGGTPSTLEAGQSIMLDVTTPAFPSYLYVTYIEASGDAVHLYTPPNILGRALAPESRVRIGGVGPGQPDLRIGPPFGAEAVVVVAAASPLFAAARPSQESDRDFLTAYRAATIAKSAGRLKGRRIAAQVLTLTTRAAPRQ